MRVACSGLGTLIDGKLRPTCAVTAVGLVRGMSERGGEGVGHRRRDRDERNGRREEQKNAG